MNGDAFSWSDMWPVVAEAFGVVAEGPGDDPVDLVAFMAEKVGIWVVLMDERGEIGRVMEETVEFCLVVFMAERQRVLIVFLEERVGIWSCLWRKT